ncbi:hypothetical protein CFC21_066051 [Triticum aestivum]|uniref:NB-ARC domain-containing protein n=4 Tax=Triticum TaxID=4564 RepID=A0A9R0TT78_TRITD|nr:hypothetical protein CFC21_066051 [Triticum aestivum]VAI18085.1 unnamed protein product [Triticum turgidum subsp. durum]
MEKKEAAMAQAIVQSLCTKLRSTIAVGDKATGDLQEIMEMLEAIHPLLEDAERRCLCFKDDVPKEGSKEIMGTPEAIQPLLEDAPQQMEGKKVRDWLRRVVKAAYDILDVLQDTMTPSARKLTKMIPRANAPEKKNLMAGKMEKIKEEVCKLRVDMDEFNLMSSDSDATIEPQVIDVKEFEEPTIVGRDKEMQMIMESIFMKKGHHIIVQIGWREDGSGKTTLAQMVFSHSRFKDYSRVWFQCSGNFPLQEMGKAIISQVSGEEISGDSNDNIEYVRKRLHQLFDNGIKVLVVLDNTQLSSDDSEKLGGMLREWDNHSEVILIATGENIYIRIYETNIDNVCAF